MKINMRKILSLALAVVMAVPALAFANTTTISQPTQSGESVQMYEFVGDDSLGGDEDRVPQWIWTPTYECTADGVNIRESASTSSTPIGTLNKGDQIGVHSINGSWAKVDLGNFKSGYVWASYLKKL